MVFPFPEEGFYGVVIVKVKESARLGKHDFLQGIGVIGIEGIFILSIVVVVTFLHAAYDFPCAAECFGKLVGAHLLGFRSGESHLVSATGSDGYARHGSSAVGYQLYHAKAFQVESVAVYLGISAVDYAAVRGRTG